VFVSLLLSGLWVRLLLLEGFLDDTDGDGLLHISDSESSEWWEFVESLNNHWLGWGHSDDTSITRLEELWERLGNNTSSLVHLVFDFGELASDMAGVAIEDWSVTVHDLTWMVHDDNLSLEPLSVLCWLSLGIRGDVTSLDVSDGESLDVETNVVPWNSFGDLLVMHLDGLDIGDGTEWTEADIHVWLDDTSFDSTDWDSSNTRDLVDILKWESQWLKYWSLWWLDGIKGLKEKLSLVPWHVFGHLEHVVTDPSGNWDEWNSLDLVTNLLKISGDLSLDFVVSSLRVISGVHLVAANDHLLDTHGEGQESMLSGLSLLGPSRLELS